MNLYKKFLETQKLTADKVGELEPEAIQKLMIDFTEYIGTETGLKNKELEEALKLQGLAHDELEKKLTDKEQASYGEQISKFINDKAEEIKKAFKSQSGFVEIELKAVANMTTGSAVNVGDVPTLYGDLTGFNFKDSFVQGLISNGKTSKESYRYTELYPKDGDYTFVAEGALKPQIDFEMKSRTVVPVKAAAWIRLTEEAVDDIPRMESLAKEYLAKKHDVFKQRKLIKADEDDIKGMTVYGRLFVAGSMALAVENPSFMDVIGACLADISNTHNYDDEMPFDANVVMINNIDYFLQVQAEKVEDGSKKPLFGLNTRNLGNVKLVPTNEIPSGKVLVCDAKAYNQIAYKPYTVRIGWVNDDFIKNQFVIIGESRFYGFVKHLDENAFIYDDISVIKAAIEKVA